MNAYNILEEMQKIADHVLVMDLAQKINAINELREIIHAVSPFKNEPVDFVRWVENSDVRANDYNPNSVAPPEMKLLETMPTKTSNHYKNKIAVYLNWWSTRGYEEGIPDKAEVSLESYGKVPTWRKICKTILRNDYWCKGLGFSPTKSQAYKKYCELMKKRRDEWGVFKKHNI